MYKGYIYRHWRVNKHDVEKSYIGQVYNRTPQQRWGKNGKGYKPRKKNKKPSKFYQAIQEHGWDNFNHEILLTIECETLKELVFWLDAWEKYYIEKYDSFYNGYNGDTGGRNGYIVSEETKQKQRKAQIERLANMSDEAKRQQSKKMSEARKGKYAGEKHPSAKKIICLEAEQVFTTIKEAREWCGCGSSNICLCLKGRQKSAGKHPETGEKLHWMYYDEYLKLKG